MHAEQNPSPHACPGKRSYVDRWKRIVAAARETPNRLVCDRQWGMHSAAELAAGLRRALHWAQYWARHRRITPHGARTDARR